ncbi:MAG: LPS export ABC transporter ATP-binding protein [Candidatus Sumerlaeota bacterium]|nr:LPS export ABC transporter ATP-binding protein [Candidatus Sumerlaeota bacterium]
MGKFKTIQEYKAVLRGKGLVKSYSGRRVVNDVNIELRQGEIVGLLGPNGAGKTTSFNMIIGLCRPTAGRVYIDDDEITHDPMFIRARKGISYLAQEDSIFRKLTVEDNIKAILETLPLTPAERKERQESILEDMGINHVRKNLGYECSGGEKRRVEIARALVTQPKFILLDEPFAAVDPKGVEDLQDVIHQMADSNIGVLITDHSVRETLAITDRSYIIFEGRVEISGPAEFLINDEQARKLYLGERFRMDESEIIRR